MGNLKVIGRDPDSGIKIVRVDVQRQQRPASGKIGSVQFHKLFVGATGTDFTAKVLWRMPAKIAMSTLRRTFSVEREEPEILEKIGGRLQEIGRHPTGKAAHAKQFRFAGQEAGGSIVCVHVLR